MVGEPQIMRPVQLENRKGRKERKEDRKSGMAHNWLTLCLVGMWGRLSSLPWAQVRAADFSRQLKV